MDFRAKFRFLNKILSFGQNFEFWRKIFGKAWIYFLIRLGSFRSWKIWRGKWPNFFWSKHIETIYRNNSIKVTNWKRGQKYPFSSFSINLFLPSSSVRYFYPHYRFNIFRSRKARMMPFLCGPGLLYKMWPLNNYKKLR